MGANRAEPTMPQWWRPWPRAESNILLQAEATAQLKPDAPAFKELDDKGVVQVSLTFKEVWDKAYAISAKLRAPSTPSFFQHAHGEHRGWGATHGDRVLLCYGPGAVFFPAFLGCLRASTIGVPVYPPNPAKMGMSVQKIAAVQEACGARICLEDYNVRRMRWTVGVAYSWPAQLTFHCTEGIQGLPSPALELSQLPEPGDVAFLQFTSGSTGNPKGVMISFSNLNHNVNHVNLPAWVRSFKRRGLDPEEEQVVGISWLPQFHDTGLVILTLAPYLAGFTMVQFSPLAFMGDPLLYVRALAEHGAHFTAAPDFAFDLCVRRSQLPGQQDRLTGLSLARLRVIACAAGQRCNPGQLLSFQDAFAPLGLRDDVWIPCYGLAEHVVATCGSDSGLTMSKSNPNLAACGEDFLIDVRIVDPETCTEAAPGEVGEIWISSQSVAQGYWGQPELSASVFHASLAAAPPGAPEYLRTGDLGFLEVHGAGMKLFICGRIKDMIIVCGRNYYPEDIEAVVESASEEVRPGCVAAYSFEHTSSFQEEEQLGITFELRASSASDKERAAEVVAQVTRAVAAEVGLTPAQVVAIEERALPKTTSGKVSRRKTSKSTVRGQLPEVLRASSKEPLTRAPEAHPSESGGHTHSIEETQENINGIAMLIATCGEASSQTLLLFLQGFPNRAGKWHEHMKHFARLGYYCVAPNLRGVAPSEQPTGRGAYRLEAYIEDLSAILKRFGRPSNVVVAAGAGGIIAWCLACLHGEQLHGLIVSNCAHPKVLEKKWADRADPQAKISENYIGAILSPGFETSERARVALGAALDADPGLGMMKMYRANINAAPDGQLSWSSELVHTLGAVRVPVLVIWTEDNPWNLYPQAHECKLWTEDQETVIFARGTSPDDGGSPDPERNPQYRPRLEAFLHRLGTSKTPLSSVPLARSLGPQLGDRICIVGAGPAGLMAARCLHQRGFHALTIFESSPTVAGKAAGVWCEALGQYVGSGQYTINDAYELIPRLGEELGVEVFGAHMASNFASEYVPSTGAMSREYGIPSKAVQPALVQVLTESARLRSRAGFGALPPEFCEPISEFMRCRLGFTDAIMAQIDRQFFLGAAGYMSVFSSVPAAYWLKVHAHAVMEWNFVAPDGFHKIFKALATRVAAVQGTTLCTACPVEAIERSEDGVTVVAGGRAQQFDYLINTLAPNELVPLLKAPTALERRICSAVLRTDYVVTIVEATGLPVRVMVPEFWRPGHTGHVYMVSLSAAQGSAPGDAGQNGQAALESAGGAPVLYSVFQYGVDYETGEKLSDEHLMTVLREDIATLGGSITSVLGTKRWQYFPHLPPGDVAAGAYDMLEAAQGQLRTYHAGAFMGMELTEATCQYSEDLVARFFRSQAGFAGWQAPLVAQAQAESWHPEWAAFMLDWSRYVSETLGRTQAWVAASVDYDGQPCSIVVGVQAAAQLLDPGVTDKLDYLGPLPLRGLFTAHSLIKNGTKHRKLKGFAMDFLSARMTQETCTARTRGQCLRHIVTWEQQAAAAKGRWDWKPALELLVVSILGDLFQLTVPPHRLHALCKTVLAFYTAPGPARKAKQELCSLFASELLSAGNAHGLSPSEVYEQLASMFALAAFPGISVALGAIFGELLGHPSAFARARAESCTGARTCEFIAAAVLETLRLHPPVTYVTLRMRRDLVIGETAVKEGALLKLDLYHTMRSHEACEEPETFKPERFLDGRPFDHKAMLAFSAGQGADDRQCPARDPAVVILKEAVRTILQHCTFESAGSSAVPWDLRHFQLAKAPMALWLSSIKSSDEARAYGPAAVRGAAAAVPAGGSKALPVVMDILSDILGRSVGADEEVAGTGITSVQVAQLSAKLDEGAYEAPRASEILLAGMTVRDLAKLVEKGGDEAEHGAERQVEKADVFPLETSSNRRAVHVCNLLMPCCWLLGAVYLVAAFAAPAWVVTWGLGRLPCNSWLCVMLGGVPLGWVVLCALLALEAAATQVFLHNVLVPKLKTGEAISLHSCAYVAWWVKDRLLQMNRDLFLAELQRTPFLIFYFRLLGAEIGTNVELDSADVRDPHLVTIESDCSLGSQAVVQARHFDPAAGTLTAARVVIGCGARLAQSTVTLGGARVPADADIKPLSVVRASTPEASFSCCERGRGGHTCGAWLRLLGCGAALYLKLLLLTAALFTSLRVFLWILGEGVAAQLTGLETDAAVFGVVAVLSLTSPGHLCMLPVFLDTPTLETRAEILASVVEKAWWLLPLWATLIRLITPLCLLVAAVMLCWLLRPPACPGTHLGVWLFDFVADSVYLRAAGQWSSTWVLPLWYRCMGARIGRLVYLAWKGRICMPAQVSLGHHVHVAGRIAPGGASITVEDGSVLGEGSFLSSTAGQPCTVPSQTLVGACTHVHGAVAAMLKSGSTHVASVHLGTGSEGDADDFVAFPWAEHLKRDDQSLALPMADASLYAVMPFVLDFLSYIALWVPMVFAAITAISIEEVCGSLARSAAERFALQCAALLAGICVLLGALAALATATFQSLKSCTRWSVRVWSAGYWIARMSQTPFRAMLEMSFLFQGSPAYACLLRCLGVDVSLQARVFTGTIDLPMLKVDANTVVEDGAHVSTHMLSSSTLDYQPVHLQEYAVVEPGAHTLPGCIVATGQRLLANRLGLPSLEATKGLPVDDADVWTGVTCTI